MTPYLVLADGPTGEAAKSGPWGLAIILLLCAGCYFLFKSMSKHLRKVREQFPQGGPTSQAPGAGGGADGAAAEDAAAEDAASDDATVDGAADDGATPSSLAKGPRPDQDAEPGPAAE